MISFSIFLGLIIIALLWHVKGRELIVFLYIVLFPMKSVVPPSEWIFGFISPENIITVFALFYLPIAYGNVIFKKVDRQKTNAILLFLFFNFVFTYYVVLKNLIVIGIVTFPTTKSFLNHVFSLVLLVFIIKKLDNHKVYMAVEKGIVISSILIGLSIFFSEKLYSIGLAPDLGEFDRFAKALSRPSGFFMNDPNVTGMFCVINFFFILNQVLFNSKRQIPYFIALISLFLGIMETGSRSTFISLGLTSAILIFSMRKELKSHRNIFIFIVLGIVLFNLFSLYGYTLKERFTVLRKTNLDFSLQRKAKPGISLLTKTEVDASFQSRVWYWKKYLKDISDNPHYLLMGNMKPPPLKRAVHNYYFMLLYFSGIIPFLGFILLIKKIVSFRNEKKAVHTFPVICPLIACLIVLFTLAEIPPYNLSIIIAMSSGLITSFPIKEKSPQNAKKNL